MFEKSRGGGVCSSEYGTSTDPLQILSEVDEHLHARQQTVLTLLLQQLSLLQLRRDERRAVIGLEQQPIK